MTTLTTPLSFSANANFLTGILDPLRVPTHLDRPMPVPVATALTNPPETHDIGLFDIGTHPGFLKSLGLWRRAMAGAWINRESKAPGQKTLRLSGSADQTASFHNLPTPGWMVQTLPFYGHGTNPDNFNRLIFDHDGDVIPVRQPANHGKLGKRTFVTENRRFTRRVAFIRQPIGETTNERLEILVKSAGYSWDLGVAVVSSDWLCSPTNLCHTNW